MRELAECKVVCGNCPRRRTLIIELVAAQALEGGYHEVARH